MSRHIPTLNYLRSADTCLTRTRTVLYWLSVPAITDSANKCRVFSVHFNPKSLAAPTLSYNQQFAQVSMLPSGDRKQYFISRVNVCVMIHVIVAFCYICFTISHHVEKVTSSVLNPPYQRRERFLVLTSSHHVEHLLLSSWCGKTQIAHIEANRVATKSHRGRVEFGRPA